MSQVVDEMLAIYNGDELMHYGTKYHSGRYPWGSGEDPYQHDGDFLSRIARLKKEGWTETAENIKKEFGENVTLEDYRNEKTWATYTRRVANVNQAKGLREKGLSNSEIARRMNVNESTVREWFDKDSEARMESAKKTADFIKGQVDKYGMVEVGKGVELELGITRTKLDQAIYALEADGYVTLGRRVDQQHNPGQNKTTITVLCPPDTPKNALYQEGALDKIHSLSEWSSRDGGDTFKAFQYPSSMDSKRLLIRYDEDGGTLRDGLVELRPGVDDLSLGNARYSQVRILVDGTHYIKGMAVYSDELPPGVDVVFNTNKHKGTPALGPKDNTVLKPIKTDDPKNPFGSAIKANGQYEYEGKDGKTHLGLINKRADEGDWSDWQNALPSQFLSKQSKELAKRQLGIAIADKTAEYERIKELDNPTVKKYFLDKFASECDSAAVHMKGAALPGQQYHVMVPINSLKDSEVYAPNYPDGSKLALIRYPHAGPFEIPILTVNNKNKDGQKFLTKNAGDAVGVNSHNASILSGADYDGDTVMCIPTHGKNGKVHIINDDPLPGLKDFDPKASYGPATYKGEKIPLMTKKQTQIEMGKVSNLITDMTLNGAPMDEVAAAVRHSMVVIDAEKHALNYKKSEVDNNISLLKKKWQVNVDPETGKVKYGGASTIVSKATGPVYVVKKQGTPKVNIKGTDWYDPNRPEGSLIYKVADDAYYEKPRVNKRTGEVTMVSKVRTQKSRAMKETDDPYTLVSPSQHAMEMIYADYASKMKAMANEARKESYFTKEPERDKNAGEVYKNEVASLKAKLNEAEKNAPRERLATIKATAAVEAAAAAKGGKLEKKDATKIGTRALRDYRSEFGSVSRKEREIRITDREWEAIQSHAVGKTILRRILNNANVDELRERATPRTKTSMTQGQINRIKAMSASYTIAQIAEKLGVSPSTVSNVLNGRS